MLHRQICTHWCEVFLIAKFQVVDVSEQRSVVCGNPVLEGTSVQIVPVLTHIVNLPKLRLLTHGFTPVTSLQIPFACLLFLCLAGLGALRQLLFLSPLSPTSWWSLAQDGVAAEIFWLSPYC